MQTKTWCTFLTFLLLTTGEIEAESSVKQKSQRAGQILDELKDGQVDEDGDGRPDAADQRISEPELKVFLARKLGELLRADPASMSQEMDPDAYLERQVSKMVMGPRSTNPDSDAFIAGDELIHLDEVVFEPPLPPMKELLPPQLDLPRPFSNEEESLLDRLSTWVVVRQSFLDNKSIGKPASFSWTGFGSEDETLEQGRDRQKFEVRAAVTFAPQRLQLPRPGEDIQIGSYSLGASPILVYEADLSSEAKDNRNAVTHRVGVQSALFKTRPGQGLSGHNIDLTFDYVTDRDYRAEILGGTFQYSPDWLGLGIGAYLPHSPSWFYFRWRPYAGLIYADLRDVGDVPQAQQRGDLLNAFGRVTLEFLIGKHFKLTPELSSMIELQNEDSEHTLFSVAAQWALDEKERVSLLVFYERGEGPPLFKKKDVLQVGLGLKLGEL